MSCCYSNEFFNCMGWKKKRDENGKEGTNGDLSGKLLQLHFFYRKRSALEESFLAPNFIGPALPLRRASISFKRLAFLSSLCRRTSSLLLTGFEVSSLKSLLSHEDEG